MEVNSFHHQAIRDVAPPLRPTAWAEDGLVEAVEGASGESWLLAVQWHPEEMLSDAAAPERGLFRALTEAATVAY
jgi:putative glutamine amidotransferase